MAVDDLDSAGPVLPAALQEQRRTTIPLAGSPLTFVDDPVALAAAATGNLTAAEQDALLGTEAAESLQLQKPVVPVEVLAASGVSAADLRSITESVGLSPAQQAALAANETVQTALAENPTAGQQAALTVNQATQTLSGAPLADVVATASTANSEEIALRRTSEAASAAKDSETEALTVAAAGIPTAAATTGVVSPAIGTTTEAVEAEGFRPMGPQAIPYSNALAVYEIRNPHPHPSGPVPIRKDVHPPLPIGRVRPVDPLVLRQEWDKKKKSQPQALGSPAHPEEPRPPLAEKAIHEQVQQANEYLTASGAPLHLVLVNGPEGFVLDVYDCSGDTLCEVTQEVPLDLNHLLTILDNLEHEAGIIINLKT